MLRGFVFVCGFDEEEERVIGVFGFRDESGVEWLMRFRVIKSGVPMRESQVLETHLNRIRDFGGRRESMFITTSSGR